MELYMPLVRSLARRYRGPGGELEDLVQAGSIGLLGAIERYDPKRGGEFAAFAVPTVAGEMRHHLRSRGVSENASETPEPAAEDPAIGVDRLELAGAFAALDEEERQIVHLRFVADLERSEVAKRLGLSEGQLSRRTRTALAKLRNELEAEGSGLKAPRAERKTGHSGRLLLRMPPELHDDLADAAKREGVSLNRMITGILTAAVETSHDADSQLEVREIPRWLPVAVVVNVVVLAVAALAALVLLVLALIYGW